MSRSCNIDDCRDDPGIPRAKPETSFWRTSAIGSIPSILLDWRNQLCEDHGTLFSDGQEDLGNAINHSKKLIPSLGEQGIDTSNLHFSSVSDCLAFAGGSTASQRHQKFRTSYKRSSAASTRTLRPPRPFYNWFSSRVGFANACRRSWKSCGWQAPTQTCRRFFRRQLEACPEQARPLCCVRPTR